MLWEEHILDDNILKKYKNMQKLNHFGYATKVWLVSVFLAPILTTLFYAVTDPSSELLEIIPFMILFGLLFSIPNWLLFVLSVWQINQFNLPKEEKKTIISFIALFLTLALFLFVLQGDSDALSFSIPYIITLIFGIWKYDLTPPIREIKQSPISRRVKMLEDILDDENY